MTRDSAELSVLFADLGGKRLNESLGEDRARERVVRAVAGLKACVQSHAGEVIKTIGEGLMGAFDGPDGAAEAAVSMQEAIAAEESPGLGLRVGFHHGPVIVEEGDLFGDAVNVAARMQSVAKVGQIVTTRESAEALSPVNRRRARHLDRVSVKGKSEPLDVFEIVWRPEVVTRLATEGVPSPLAAVLRLHYQDRTIALEPGSSPVVLGRGKDVDLVIDDSMASREHARIECRGDKFVLVDASTNGTYLLTEDGPVYLRREETTLSGSGRISLGREPEEAEAVVDFSCER